MPAPPWDAYFPDRDALRRETRAMAQSFVDALFEVFTPHLDD